LVPAEVNRAALDVLADVEQAKFGAFVGNGEPPPDQPASLTPLADCYPAPSPLGRFLRLPAVIGIVESLLGPNPVFDHDFVHHLGPGHHAQQHLHPDAIVDSFDPTFDIQLFWFPHDVQPGAGGTRFVPGTHVRQAASATTAAYQQMVGDEWFSGPAGTVLVFHHGLWHAGQANPSGSHRWMYKVRLNPTEPQVRRWNLADFAALQNDPTDHVFARWRHDSVAAELRRTFPWEGSDANRYDLVERIRLWRYVSGDEHFDVDYYLTRLERRAALVGER
jgi:hypothetical protein